jgi:hypothetical protein
VSDTPQKDFDAEAWRLFSQQLERELNECKKSPWKPLGEIPEALKDGRSLLVRRGHAGHQVVCYLRSRGSSWIDTTSGDECDLDDVCCDFMEIPK